MDAIQSAIAKKEILDSLRPIDPEHEQRIMQKFRLDWNYHSNHIEGNSLSYGETKALILFGITGQAKPLKDYLEIEGHNSAIDWVLDIVKDKHELTENFIRELHTLLLKPSLKEAITPDGKPTTKRIQVGKYKTLPNHVLTVTGEIFRFATPEETPAEMHDLLDWYKEQRKQESLNPILLAAEFHYKFIRIHPFDDGNGRMARILMNFILMQYNYPPVIIKTENKESYYNVLRQADANVIKPFIEYIAVNLEWSLDIMISGAQGENIEDPDDIDKKILLLEQEINNTTKKIEVYRNPNIVNFIMHSCLTILLTKGLNQFNRIFGFYKNVELQIKLSDNSGWGFSVHDVHSIQQTLDYIFKSEEYSDNIRASLIFIFNSLLPFNDKSVDPNEYSSAFYIDFYATNYTVSNSLNDKIVKYYNEETSPLEFESLVKQELLKHMEFIAQKKKQTE